MKNNKLLSLLRTFSSHDFLHFRKFVASPFFNENEDLSRLLEALLDMGLLERETHDEGERLGIWKKLFPKKKFDDVRFRRLFSELLRLAFDYLAYQQSQQHPAGSRVLLLRALAGKHLEKHFSGVVRQTERELNANPFRDADHHYLSYLLHRRQHEQQEHLSQKSTSFQHLEKADFHLDCYYLAKKLEHFSDTLGYRDMTSETTEIRLIPTLMACLKDSDYLQEPAVNAWFLSVLMLRHREEDDYFFQLKKLLNSEGNLFRKQSRKVLFIHLMNYCIYSKIHNDRPEYYGELLSLYQTALEKEIIIENGELDLRHYKNIITISIRVTAFDWVENFILKYSPLLPKNDRENALTYNLANLQYHKGAFESVIENLSRVEYQTIEYALGSKLLMVQSYFELEETKALESLLDSFKIYLRRNRFVATELKQRYLNFLRFAKKLVSLAPYDDKGWEKVYLQIQNCKLLVEKEWLLKKCKVLD